MNKRILKSITVLNVTHWWDSPHWNSYILAFYCPFPMSSSASITKCESRTCWISAKNIFKSGHNFIVLLIEICHKETSYGNLEQTYGRRMAGPGSENWQAESRADEGRARALAFTDWTSIGANNWRYKSKIWKNIFENENVLNQNIEAS